MFLSSSVSVRCPTDRFHLPAQLKCDVARESIGGPSLQPQVPAQDVDTSSPWVHADALKGPEQSEPLSLF